MNLEHVLITRTERFHDFDDALCYAESLPDSFRWFAFESDYVVDKTMLGRDIMVGDYLNHAGYSDWHPYKVVRLSPSGKTAYVKKVEAELDPNWKPEVHIGGFSGHTANNNSQAYIYGEVTGNEIAVRINKKGWKSAHGRHYPSTKPVKFYDYNY
jgi:hypothetical protein